MNQRLSDDHLAFITRPNEIPDLVQEFLSGGRGAVDEDRVVKTVMFSDIVGSTEMATKLGDAQCTSVRESRVLRPPAKVLVSQTVKGLVAGSGLEFEDFGTHALKGVADSWDDLYAVKENARA